MSRRTIAHQFSFDRTSPYFSVCHPNSDSPNSGSGSVYCSSAAGGSYAAPVSVMTIKLALELLLTKSRLVFMWILP